MKFLKIIVVLALGGIRYTGTWKLVFPSHQHDTEAPAIPPGLAMFHTENGAVFNADDLGRFDAVDEMTARAARGRNRFQQS